MLKLIRAYLNAGILQNGLVSVPKEGTPQGSPLPRSSRTWFWMSWTGNWSAAVKDLSATPNL